MLSKKKNINIKINRHVFESIYKELYIELCRYCFLFVRSEKTAEDIVQEQFIYLWEKRDEISIRNSIKSYLFKAVRNKSINYLKRKYANIHFENTTEIFDITEFYTPGHEYETQELEKIINLALESLPDRCYHIFNLSRYSPLSNKQISERLNISEKTVENQITIALKKIKSYLDKNW
ncbi:MAG: RNA polymerase sigma-70 factor [Bacteroidales bacterium]|nr:MAG: RNA polymerase sigma-70 factor [Bacteroidales bacterium]